MGFTSLEKLQVGVAEMRESMRKTKKDRHLIMNMKMLVKDCTVV